MLARYFADWNSHHSKQLHFNQRMRNQSRRRPQKGD